VLVTEIHAYLNDAPKDDILKTALLKKYKGTPKINDIEEIYGTKEKNISKIANSKIKVINGETIKLIKGDIKLNVLKLYEVTGKVNTVAASVTNNDETNAKIIFRENACSLSLNL
jgi:hypothetical protein